MEEILFQYNPWWEEDYELKDVVERPFYQDLLKDQLQNRHLVFITGLRRVGKTTLMRLLIKDLLANGIEARHLLYFSADDYMLSKRNLFEILEEYKKIHRIRSEEKVYLFLDEITYQQDYRQQIKNLYDAYNMKIFASSSSTSLLKDKKAFLTGRSVTLEVRPLDFEEYKLFKGIDVKKRDDVLNEAFFKDYIREGGMPENVLSPDREYLMTLVDDIIQKDITAFHGLKNHRIVRDYFTLLMERSGKQFSINKIANILNMSPDTAGRYMRYFEETYLVHLLPRWGKTNEKILSAKKIYACDLGIKYLFIGERDLGSYFENYVYLKLKNRKELYYLYEGGIELDFLTGDGIIIEAKFNAEMNEKQKALFDSYGANRKIVIDSVKKLSILDEL